MTAAKTTRTSGARHPQITAVVLATTAPAVVWLAAKAAGADMEVTMHGQPTMRVGLPLVLIAALLANLAGWSALLLLRRVTSRSRAAWTVLSGIVLLVSFAPVISARASTGTTLALAVMHLVVAAVLVPGLRRATAT
ncbi:DUF6069 family protein [Streptomyces spirodelae]|uniref:Uncharacterized protein n=1 Tax=Streptomyces spirodelae TaxID=2812904 RepID=A0ABS3WU74_9ACTN|nr:DUF6069 family protein [Streptomyces spirodelae]MBO8186382.1 hypothetical protein [Streptomyces spirodelae]